MKLVFVEGAFVGRQEILKPIGSVIGRCAPADIHLDDQALISRQHCRIFQVDDKWMIEDLGSVNGVLINGSRIPPSKAFPIQSGDRIAIANIVTSFVDDNASSPPVADVPPSKTLGFSAVEFGAVTQVSTPIPPVKEPPANAIHEGQSPAKPVSPPPSASGVQKPIPVPTGHTVGSQATIKPAPPLPPSASGVQKPVVHAPGGHSVGSQTAIKPLVPLPAHSPTPALPPSASGVQKPISAAGNHPPESQIAAKPLPHPPSPSASGVQKPVSEATPAHAPESPGGANPAQPQTGEQQQETDSSNQVSKVKLFGDNESKPHPLTRKILIAFALIAGLCGAYQFFDMVQGGTGVNIDAMQQDYRKIAGWKLGKFVAASYAGKEIVVILPAEGGAMEKINNDFYAGFKDGAGPLKVTEIQAVSDSKKMAEAEKMAKSSPSESEKEILMANQRDLLTPDSFDNLVKGKSYDLLITFAGLPMERNGMAQECQTLKNGKVIVAAPAQVVVDKLIRKGRIVAAIDYNPGFSCKPPSKDKEKAFADCWRLLTKENVK